MQVTNQNFEKPMIKMVATTTDLDCTETEGNDCEGIGQACPVVAGQRLIQ